jgi:lipoate-protein ligase A
LLFSLVLAYERSPALREIRPSYGYILGRIRDELADLVPGLQLAGVSDLAWQGRKCSGNAQQRKRDHLLHHGTLLHGFDAQRIERYLHMPGRQPDYRGGREHAAFLTNVPIDRPELVQRLREAWKAGSRLTSWPAQRVVQLVEEKYAQTEWIRRR